MIEPQAQKRGIALKFPRFRDNPCFHQRRPDANQAGHGYQSFFPMQSNTTVTGNGRGDVRTRRFGPDSRERERYGNRIVIRETVAAVPAVQSSRPGSRRHGRHWNRPRRYQTWLIELMGGVIGVESIVGMGSVFWIQIMLTSAAPAFKEVDFGPTIPATTPVESGVPLRSLLYVEDNPANLKLVQQLIARRSGYTSADGGER